MTTEWEQTWRRWHQAVQDEVDRRGHKTVEAAVNVIVMHRMVNEFKDVQFWKPAEIKFSDVSFTFNGMTKSITDVTQSITMVGKTIGRR